MSVREQTLRTAVLGALRDLIDGEYTHARGAGLETMLAAWRETGSKSFDVRLPDGSKVAAITLVEPSDEVVVTDRPAFTRWVQERAPEMVEQEASPLDRVEGVLSNLGMPHARQAAQAVLAELGMDEIAPDPRVSRVYEEGILADLQPISREPDQDMSAVLVETGEIVPGVEYRVAGEPTRFQMRYTPRTGREAIAAAWRAGELSGIEGLPEIQS